MLSAMIKNVPFITIADNKINFLRINPNMINERHAFIFTRK